MKKLLTPALALSLFLLLVGAHWAVFDRFGSPMPDWDQWDAEASELFTPWFESDHFVQHLFNPHNEHRVVLTKLQNLALGLLNGQWDSRLEVVTNAMLHAALGVAFWLCVCEWIRERPKGRDDAPRPAWGLEPAEKTAPHRPRAMRSIAPTLKVALFVMTAALFGLPLAWQNILGGFHSQQYWLLAFSFVAIVGLPFARPGSVTWWAAALATVLALGSLASGLLAAAMVTGVVGWRLFRRESNWREAWPTLMLSTAVLAFGAATRVEFAGHENLKATSFGEFCLCIVRSLEWPLRDHDWAAVVMWVPWAVLVWKIIRKHDGASSRGAQTIAALGTWVLLQITATAYARGAGADYPASRYMDTLAFGAMANAAALAWLLEKRPKDQETKRPSDFLQRRCRSLFVPWSFGPLVPWSLGRFVSTSLWLVTLGWGLYKVCDDNLRYELPDAKKYYIRAESVMTRYLATDDPKHLDSPDIPFPSADGLIERLSHPSLRALMPVPIRAPLPLVPANQNASVFLENDARSADWGHPPHAGLSPTMSPLEGARSWGSFAPDGISTGKTGEWRSAPITSTLGGWLKFETAGHLGNPNGGVALELRSAANNTLLATIEPTKVPGHAWRAAYARAPREAFVVVARDEHAARWLAFSAPVEMGRLSYWAWRASKHGMLIMYCAAAAAAALGAISWWSSLTPGRFSWLRVPAADHRLEADATSNPAA